MDKGNKKEKLIVQGVCLLLSIGLWFYVSNVENPTRTIIIDDIYVELLGVQNLKDVGLALISPQELFIDLKVEGQSTDIYKVNKNDFELEVNLDEYALKKGENRVPVKVVDSPSTVNVKNINSLNVKIVLDTYKEKVIPIQSEVVVKAAKGYFASDPQLSLNKVTVSGSAASVEKVEKAVIRGTIENISSDVNKSYNLVAVDSQGEDVKDVDLSQQSIDININVNKSKLLPVNVVTEGSVLSGRLVSITPSISSVEVNGPESALKDLQEINTSAIDLSQLSESEQLKVNLIIPNGVKLDKDLVTVKIEIENQSSKEISLPLNVIGKLDTLVYKFSAEEVKIKVQDYEQSLKDINSNNFIASIDLTNLGEGEHELIPEITIVGDHNFSYEVLDKIKVIITNF